MNSRRVQYYGFEANGVEVQLHVDVCMRQKAETQTTKIKSAKSFVRSIRENLYPRNIPAIRYDIYVSIPVYYTHAMVIVAAWNTPSELNI